MGTRLNIGAEDRMVKDSKIIMKQAIVCSGNNKGMRGQIVAADNKSVTLELILDFRV